MDGELMVSSVNKVCLFDFVSRHSKYFMVLRVDLIADIYLTSSIPMVPFRTTWKLHMDFIEKSFNCFLYLNETSFFFFFFFYFLRTFVSFLPFPRIFLFFLLTRDSIFSYWNIFFRFILLRSFLSFKITFLPQRVLEHLWIL